MKDLSHAQNNSEQKTFTCPMHPEVIKQAPGKCPVCGMELVPVDKNRNALAEDHLNPHSKTTMI